MKDFNCPYCDEYIETAVVYQHIDNLRKHCICPNCKFIYGYMYDFMIEDDYFTFSMEGNSNSIMWWNDMDGQLLLNF